MSDPIIEHVSDYVKYIEHLSDTYYYAPQFVYRGQGNGNYRLIPSVFRMYQEETRESPCYLNTHVYEGERTIIQEFIMEAASFVQSIPREDKFSWIEFGQHFGIPTRLLDWTTNPLVALFFACSSNPNDDAKVFVLCESAYRQIINKKESEELSKHTIKEHVVNMIWEKKRGFPHPVVIRPYYIDRRMSAQSSCFMVWGDIIQPLEAIIEKLERNEKGQLLCEEVEEGGGSYYSKAIDSLTFVTIHSENKLRILHELDGIGINNATLFPGLDGIGKAIEWRRNYNNNLRKGEI